MCSELFRIPIEWRGVPIFGFGVLLALWLVAGGWSLAAAARSAGWSAALKAGLPTYLLVAGAIAALVPRFFPGGLPLRSYGLMVVLGSALGLWMAMRRAREARLHGDEIMGLAVVLFLSGIVGARLFFVIEYWPTRIRQADWRSTLLEALKYTEGGLVVYGAFIGGMIGFAWYVVRRKLPPLAMADLVAPSMLAGLALGRIGCLMNGCCYGGESQAPWAIAFPQENAPGHLSPPYGDQAAAGRFWGFRIAAADGKPIVDRVDPGTPASRAKLAVGAKIASVNDRRVTTLDEARDQIFGALAAGRPLSLATAAGGAFTLPAIELPARSLPVHPAQIYSAVDAGLLAWLLWCAYPYRTRDGQVMALMITLHPISRFLLEIIRVDESPVFGTSLSISQNLSLALLAVAGGLWFWVQRQPAKKLAFPLTGPAAA